MSRKTDEIRKSLLHLEELQKGFFALAEEIENPKLTLASEEMKAELENLRLWISMLYKYNGTSKSHAKIAASRENGKKGGRPPKLVSDLKKQRVELEALLADLHNQQLCAPIEDEMRISEEARRAESELEDLNSRLSQIGR